MLLGMSPPPRKKKRRRKRRKKKRRRRKKGRGFRRRGLRGEAHRPPRSGKRSLVVYSSLLERWQVQVWRCSWFVERTGATSLYTMQSILGDTWRNYAGGKCGPAYVFEGAGNTNIACDNRPFALFILY